MGLVFEDQWHNAVRTYTNEDSRWNTKCGYIFGSGVGVPGETD